MLISATLENWMSFKNPTQFSMIAGREQRFGEKLYPVKKYNMRLLPITAIYGGNASGKSNFLKGIDFASDLIKGRYRNGDNMPVNRFKLDNESKSKPTIFTFEFLADKIFYEYSFSATDKQITHEKLTEISSSSEKILFELEDGLSVAPYNFELKIEVGKDKTTGEIQYLAEEQKAGVIEQLIATKNSTQLFLNRLSQRKIPSLKHVMRVLTSIDVILPNTGVINDLNNTAYYKKIGKFLGDMDTGISDVRLEDAPEQQWNDIFPDAETSEAFKKMFLENAADLSDDFALPLPKGFFVVKAPQGIALKRLRTFHRSETGDNIPFDINEESDGTRRLLEILPAYIPLLSNNDSQTLFVDELDRSFHNKLTRKLLETYLESCNAETQKQLIFTTHDMEIMDTDLLRRDEMWFAQRDNDGASSLISLAEFSDIRSKNDIRKRYQEGRFGGVPNLI